MDRINDPSAPARLFLDADLVNGVQGSILRALWANGVQEELVGGLIERAGLTANPADNTQIFQAISLLMKGRVLSRVVVTQSGMQSPPPGASRARVFLQGGGGAGAGAQAVSGSSVSPASGGTAGSWAFGIVAVSGPVMVTIGAGGAPQVGGNGFPGGMTSFGSAMSAPGGPGGQVSPPGPAGGAIGGSNGSPGVGGDEGGDGMPGGISYSITSATGYGGAGGSSQKGGGGAAVSQNINGNAGTAAGSGGGGTCTTSGNGALSGGRGANGVAIIEWIS